MLLFVWLLTFLLVFATYRLIFQSKSRFRLPPGPTAWPLVGNAFQLGSSPFLAHHELSKTYGDIHSVSVFGHKVVVVNSIEAIKDCNLGSSDVFNHRPVWLKIIAKSFTPGIVFRGVNNYVENRRFFLNNMKKRGMGKSELEPTIGAETALLLNYLEKNCPLDPKAVLTNFTSNMVSQVCFERRWEYGDESYTRFQHAIERINSLYEVLALVDFLPVLGYVPKIKSLSSENDDHVAHIQNFFADIIEEKQKNNSNGVFDGYDIVDDYLNAHKDISVKELRNLVEICHDLFFAGTETTASTLGFAIIHLIKTQSYKKRCLNKLIQLFKEEILHYLIFKTFHLLRL